MIDAFNGFWVRDSSTGRPLGALEFRDRLRLSDPLSTVELVRLRPPPASYRDEHRMIAYYQRGVEQFYLWWGNNVFDYDLHPLVRAGARSSRSLEQLAAMTVGIHPRIRIPLTPANGGMVAALEQTRTRVTALGIACVVLVIALVWVSTMWWRAGHRTI
jgi:hypothetical protein